MNQKSRLNGDRRLCVFCWPTMDPDSMSSLTRNNEIDNLIVAAAAASGDEELEGSPLNLFTESSVLGDTTTEQTSVS